MSFGSLSDRSVGKLRQEGLTDAQIRANLSIFDRGDGSLISGWGQQAKRIRDAGQREDLRHEAREDTEHLLVAMAEYGIAQAQANYEFGQRAAEANLERYPRITAATQEATGESADFLTEYMREAFTEMLDALTPGWRERIIDPAMGSHQAVADMTKRFTEDVLPEALDAVDDLSRQMLEITASQLRGELNPDVAASLKREMAEISQQMGIRGQAAQYLTARDLGMTSMELQEKGLANAGVAAQFQSGMYGLLGNTAQMAIRSGADLTNLLSAYRAPIADIQALYGAQLAGVTQAGMIPASTVLQTGAQVQTSASGQALNATESMYGYNAQLMMNQQAMNLQQQMLRQQTRSNRLGGIGSAIGSVAGMGVSALVPGAGAMGLLLGAGLGGGVGGNLFGGL